MAYMFSECNNLKELDLKSFNTSNVTDMGYMFYWCSSLEKLKIGENFNTSIVLHKENMFDHCDKLSEDIKNNI